MSDQLSEFEVSFLKGLDGVILALDTFCHRTGELKSMVLFYLLKLELLNQKDIDAFNNIDWLLETNAKTYSKNNVGGDSIIFRSRNTFPSEFCDVESHQEVAEKLQSNNNQDVLASNQIGNIPVKLEPATEDSQQLPHSDLMLENLEPGNEDEELTEAVLQVQNPIQTSDNLELRNLLIPQVMMQEPQITEGQIALNSNHVDVANEDQGGSIQDASENQLGTEQPVDTVIKSPLLPSNSTLKLVLTDVMKDNEDIQPGVSLPRQILVKDKSIVNAYSCQYCTKTFSLRYQLNRHLFTHSNERQFKCLFCEKSFKDRNNMTTHMKIKHSDKKFKCPSCPKEFASARALSNHSANRHSDVMKYRCKLCQHPFSSMSNFKKHKDVHMLKNVSVCEICGWAFGGSGMLFLHQKKHHKDTWIEKTKQLSCSKKSSEEKEQLDTMDTDDLLDLEQKSEPLQDKDANITGKKERPKRPIVKPKKFCEDLADLDSDVTSENTDTLITINTLKTENDTEDINALLDGKASQTIVADGIFINNASELYCENNKETYKEFRQYIFKCLYCTEEFRQRNDYISHVVEVHKQTQDIPFLCNMCTQTFYVMAEFRKHIRWHKTDYTCYICSELFHQKWDFNRHMKEKHDVDFSLLTTESHVCDKCGKNFLSKSALNHHMKLHSRPFLFKCTVCENREFRGKAELKFHMKSHDVTQVPGVEKILHKKEVKKDLSHRKYSCAFCEQLFLHKTALLEHMNKVHEHTEEILFPCSFCDKAFSTVARVKRHEITHGLAKHECNVCGRSFNDKGNFNKHVRTHTGVKDFQCKTCGKAYTSKNALVIHERKHTGERPHICSKCGKTFTNGGALLGHMRIHTGEMPYTCEICGFKFKDRSHMNRHIKSHSKLDHIRPHRCQVRRCGRSFSSKASLNKHVETMHSTEVKDEDGKTIVDQNILQQAIEVGSFEHPRTIIVSSQI